MSLKTAQAEYDAQRMASMWKEHGKEAAQKVYAQIVARVKMVQWESVIFCARVRELIKEI